MEQAVVFGAGSIGRGFIGQLLSESGYQVVFVDIDEPLIAALNARGSYTIHLAENDHCETVTVEPVRGLLSADAEAVMAALAEAPLGATAVGARALPHIAPLIAGAVARRMEAGNAEPLNLILCENLPDAAGYLRGLITEQLDAEGHGARAYFDAHVGLVNAVIGRMVPEPTPEMQADDISAILTEPFKELPVDGAAWVGEVPVIVGLELREPFAPYVERKLYLHNAAHALMGYLGYQRGYKLGYETLDDPVIRPLVEGALDEAVQGLVARHGLEEAALRDHVAALWPRLANRGLADPVSRLARGVLRKLAPDDRLVGASHVATEAGLSPSNLAWGIGAALAYDAPDDDEAQELQERIAREGVDRVLASVCEIEPEEPLGALVLERYGRVRDGVWAP